MPKKEDSDSEEEESENKEIAQIPKIKNIALLNMFEAQFHSRFEEMNPEDISKYYYCFTKIGHHGNGRFYKYL